MIIGSHQGQVLYKLFTFTLKGGFDKEVKVLKTLLLHLPLF